MRHIVCILALAVLVSCTGSQEDVCGIFPLSGEMAVWGQEPTRGMELALGDRMRLEDDRYERRATVTAARKLLDDGCELLVVPFIETSRPILPLLESEHVPAVLVYDRTRDVDANEYLFSTGYPTELSAETMAAYMRAQGERTAIVLYEPVEWSLIHKRSFMDAFEREDGDVLEALEIAPDDDFLSVATKISARKPDAIYSAQVARIDVLLRRLKEQGLDVQFYAAEGFSDDEVQAAGAAAEGACRMSVPPAVSEDAQRVLQRYEERYGEPAVIPEFVVYGYDTGMVLREIIEATPYERVSLRNALQQFQGYISPLGDTIDLTDGGGTWRSTVVSCVVNGTLVEQAGSIAESNVPGQI